jgi:drug/metabolite transporter (DMT)-like permease
MSLFLIVGWTLWRCSAKCFITGRPRGHFWRAGLGFCAMEIWFYSLSILPLNVATALSFTIPVFGTVFAIQIFGEKAGWRRWSAIGVSFVGVLIILRPGSEALDASAGIVLVSSALMALAGTIVKSLTRTEPPETIVFYMALFMTPLSLPPALFHWGPVTMELLCGVALVALFSTAAHLLIARAYRYAEMVVLLPFDFTRLIFTGILAYLFFGETLDSATLAGGVVIMAASCYIAHREALTHRKRSQLLADIEP